MKVSICVFRLRQVPIMVLGSPSASTIWMNNSPDRMFAFSCSPESTQERARVGRSWWHGCARHWQQQVMHNMHLSCVSTSDCTFPCLQNPTTAGQHQQPTFPCPQNPMTPGQHQHLTFPCRIWEIRRLRGILGWCEKSLGARR